MDKRTILFVILLTFALFGVNILFEGQRQEKIRSWSEEVKADQTKKLKLLENDQLRTTLAANGREYAQQISWERASDYVMEIYRRVIEMKASGKVAVSCLKEFKYKNKK